MKLINIHPQKIEYWRSSYTMIYREVLPLVAGEIKEQIYWNVYAKTYFPIHSQVVHNIAIEIKNKSI